MGSFDPVSGTANDAAEFNAWSTSDFELTRSASHPNSWVGTHTLAGAAGNAEAPSL